MTHKVYSGTMVVSGVGIDNGIAAVTLSRDVRAGLEMTEELAREVAGMIGGSLDREGRKAVGQVTCDWRIP